MALEVELKFCGVDHEQVRSMLRRSDAVKLGRYFEENLVFDDENRSLRKRGVLLRLRRKEGQTVLTIKHPPQGPEERQRAKVREELETEIGNFVAMRAGLNVLGYSHTFAYQKFREKWQFGECVVCLDLLPFGEFVEIEGSEPHKCASMLGLDLSQSSKKSYHALNRAFRKDNDLPDDENFIFDDCERDRLEKTLC